jgi:hypothetical protein
LPAGSARVIVPFPKFKSILAPILLSAQQDEPLFALLKSPAPCTAATLAVLLLPTVSSTTNHYFKLSTCRALLSFHMKPIDYIVVVGKNGGQGKGYPKSDQTFQADFNELLFILIALNLIEILGEFND